MEEITFPELLIRIILFFLAVYMTGRLFGAGVIRSYVQLMKERKKDNGQKTLEGE